MNIINSLSIIIPLYNDSYNVNKIIDQTLSLLKKIKIKYEIILVDDLCPQQSGKLAFEYCKKIKNIKVIFNNNNLGYGGAIKKGIINSKNKWLFIVDGDGQYDVSNLLKLLKRAKKNNLVITYRKPNSNNFIRIFISFFYTLLLNFLFKTKIKDFSSGCRLIDKKIFNQFKINTNGPFFGAELILKAKYYNFLIKEVPIKHNLRKSGDGSIVNFENIFKTLKEIFYLYRDINAKNKT